MDIILWVGLGLIAGGVVSLIYDDSFGATMRNILFGFIGSIIGGGIMTTWDSEKLSTNEFYIYSILFTILISTGFIFLARSQKTIMTGIEYLNKSSKFDEDEYENEKIVSSTSVDNKLST